MTAHPLTRRDFCLALGVGLTATLLPSVAAAELGPAAGPRCLLQPFGKLAAADELERMQVALRARFAMTLVFAEPATPPRSTLYPPRQRLRAEKILSWLETIHPSERHIIGLTASDISTTKAPYADWGILGLANCPGRACVVSSFRAARGGRSADQRQTRFAKTVLHELGHTFGLPHCRSPGCLMSDGAGTFTTTDGERDYCGNCSRELARSEAWQPEPGRLPWE